MSKSPKRRNTSDSPSKARKPLTPERVIEGGIELADQIGMEAFTIRKLAEAIDVKPMTIYHHISNKDAIIDGMVNQVFREIDLPPTDLDWRSAIQVRSKSMRSVLAAHPWAAPLMDSRTPGEDTLRHHNAFLGCFRNAGFSLKVTAHAYAAIDSFLYGFALQEATLPTVDEADQETDMAGAALGDSFPHLMEFATEHVMAPGYNFGDEFEVGLNLILDGLEQLRGQVT